MEQRFFHKSKLKYLKHGMKGKDLTEFIDPFVWVLEYDFYDKTFRHNKYAQEFITFIRGEDVQKAIEAVRRKCNLNKDQIFSDIIKFKTNVDERKNIPKQDWENFQRLINSKIKLEQGREILRCFDKPISWENALTCYLVSGIEIIPTASQRTYVYINQAVDRVVVEISPEANLADVKKAFKEVDAYQKLLPGYKLKSGKRIKKKFDQHLAIAKDSQKLKKLSGRQREAAHFKILQKYNPKLREDGFDTIQHQKREANRHRQISHRYKGRIFK